MKINPNWFAYFALCIWPLIIFVLFARLPAGRALIWSILGAYLILPDKAEIKFEGVPALDKNTIPNLAVLIAVAFAARRIPRVLSSMGLVEVLILTYLFTPFVTSLLNGDNILIGQTFLPGLGYYEGISASANQFILFIPFFLGRQLLRNADDTLNVLKAIALGGIFYSLPILFEIRFSPQLHNIFYGYFPHSFFQQFRDEGFRPVVFIGHGLLVAFFIMTATVAASALWRLKIPIARLPPAGATAFLAVLVVFCKTFSAIFYGALIVPLVRWATPRAQMKVALALSLIVMCYPILRTIDLIPTKSILESVNAIDSNRAVSLKFRFDNEEPLLERALERMWWGWGRFGRSRVYHEETGQRTSVTDGYWVITLGQFGMVGFIGEFGLLAFALWRCAAALKFARTNEDRVAMAALTLILAVSMLDLLPNSSMRPWTWLLAGALLGRAESARQASAVEMLNRSIQRA